MEGDQSNFEPNLVDLVGERGTTTERLDGRDDDGDKTSETETIVFKLQRKGDGSKDRVRVVDTYTQQAKGQGER